MNETNHPLQEVLRRAHARRDVPEPPAAWTADVLRTLRARPAADSGAVWLWSAALASSAAAAVVLLAVATNGWDLGLGGEWFNDPLGLGSLWLLDV